MVYIPENAHFAPGNLLGDAKTMVMHKLPFDAKEPLTISLVVGSIVYIDLNGNVVPYDRSGASGATATPYGVVWKMTKANPEGPHSSANKNEVTVVTEGIVCVEYKSKDKSLPPKLGQPVDEYGCLFGSADGKYVIGISEGLGTDPTDSSKIVVAVRLTPTTITKGGISPLVEQYRAYNAERKKEGNDDKDDGTIPAYAPVRRVLTSNPEGIPSVKLWTTEAQGLYGYAVEAIQAEGTGTVVTHGKIDLPYVLAEKVTDKDELSRGYRVAWVLNHYENSVPWYEKVFIFIKEATLTIGDVCSTVLDVCNTKKAWNEAFRVKDDKPAKVYGKLSLTSSEEEPVIDGWVTVDVNPVNIRSASSLDYAVSGTKDPLIPGHVYGGTDSGVWEFATNWDGLPFVGVCTALPSVDNKTPLVREGAVDVVAADDWHAGDYIDYTRHSIPEAYEPFIPHIGVAHANTKYGELGAVHLDPWDPNTYESYRGIDLHTPPTGTTVFFGKGAGTPEVCVLEQVPEDFSGVPPSSGFDVLGILRASIPVDPFTANVIVQTGGYMLVQSMEVHLPGDCVFKVGLDLSILDKYRLISGRPPLSNRDQLGNIVDAFTSAELLAKTYVVKLDVKNHWRPPKTSTVPGAPVVMNYTPVLHFGWWRASEDSPKLLRWKSQDAGTITVGIDPSFPDLQSLESTMGVYLSSPSGTVFTATSAGKEESCMSNAAVNFYHMSQSLNILKNECVFRRAGEAQFQLNEFGEEQLEHLEVGEVYTYHFGVTFNRRDAVASGYVSLVYDGEYKEESPTDPELVVEQSVNDDTKHELKEDQQGEPSLIIDPPVYEQV